MKRRMSRWKLGTAVTALAMLLIVLGVTLWTGGPAYPGGDPGGRIMAGLAPVVSVIPGFDKSNIPWIAPPCDSCQFPARYALKIETSWDGCPPFPKSFGWDPVIIQAGFLWSGSRQALVDLLNRRLEARGWVRGAAPWASVDPADVWIHAQGVAHSEAFSLSPPQPQGTDHQWMATIMSKPNGRLVGSC
jgi:hypothetical protein